MQQADPGYGNTAAAPAAPDTGGGAPAQTPAQPSRKRLSLLDAIGRVSDVLAKVGGADPLYQSTLDANKARQQADEDRQRAIINNDLNAENIRSEIANRAAGLGKTQAETQKTVAEVNAQRYGAALRGLQAIQKAGGDIARAWPILAQQQSIPEEDAARLWGLIQANPNSVEGLAQQFEKSGRGGSDNFGLQPFFAHDAQGNVRAFQLGKDGTLHPVELPEGFSPASSVMNVDTGDRDIILDKRTGAPVRNIVKSGGPQKGEAPILDAQGNIVGYRALPGSNLDYTRNNPPPGKGAANPFTTYSEARSGLVDLANQLDQIAGDKDLPSATGIRGSIEGHIPGTAAKRIQGNIATAKGQALTAAINHLKALGNGQLGFRLTQQEATAFGNALAGALEKTDQSSTDYVNNLRSGKQRIMQMIQRMDQDALRNGYVVQGPDGKLRPAPPKSAPAPAVNRPILTTRPRAGAQPTVSNW
jgi:hypothetical protein